MENNVQPLEQQTDELSADILKFTEMFKQLSPEAKAAMLEILHLLNDID